MCPDQTFGGEKNGTKGQLCGGAGGRDDCMGGSPRCLRVLASSIRLSNSFNRLTAPRSTMISSKEVYSILNIIHSFTYQDLGFQKVESLVERVT